MIDMTSDLFFFDSINGLRGIIILLRPLLRFWLSGNLFLGRMNWVAFLLVPII